MVNRRKLTDQQVIEIEERRNNGESLRKVAIRYGISHETVRLIERHEIHRSLLDSLNGGAAAV